LQITEMKLASTLLVKQIISRAYLWCGGVPPPHRRNGKNIKFCNFLVCYTGTVVI